MEKLAGIIALQVGRQPSSLKRNEIGSMNI
jgi:hypothetical protein